MSDEISKPPKPPSGRQIAERFKMRDNCASRVFLFYEMFISLPPFQTRAAIESAFAALDEDGKSELLMSASGPMELVSLHESRFPIDETGRSWRYLVEKAIEEHNIDLILPWWESTNEQEYSVEANTHLSHANYLIEQFKFMQIAYELMQPEDVERRQRVTSEYKEAIQAIDVMEKQGLLDGNGYPRCDLPSMER